MRLIVATNFDFRMKRVVMNIIEREEARHDGWSKGGKIKIEAVMTTSYYAHYQDQVANRNKRPTETGNAWCDVLCSVTGFLVIEDSVCLLTELRYCPPPIL